MSKIKKKKRITFHMINDQVRNFRNPIIIENRLNAGDTLSPNSDSTCPMRMYKRCVVFMRALIYRKKKPQCKLCLPKPIYRDMTAEAVCIYISNNKLLVTSYCSTTFCSWHFRIPIWLIKCTLVTDVRDCSLLCVAK